VVKWEWGLANFLHWEMGFEALRLGFCQWKTATGKGILAKLQLEIGFGKKKKKTWAGKWELTPVGSSTLGTKIFVSPNFVKK